MSLIIQITITEDTESPRRTEQGHGCHIHVDQISPVMAATDAEQMAAEMLLSHGFSLMTPPESFPVPPDSTIKKH
ncbi:hypothetical protein ABGO37_003161 [Escherichia coli]|uniref:hypothetical protein n=1 Tax=Escherichia coli TaxID=562 RepID=UPI0015EAF558|nr:hypothetical protein [Escherichia coli]EAY4098264.1 hypothetical protein [Salmonella enterica]EGD7795800.1 hypothetical protein [Escherichia coli]EGM8565155.1 hypothetical protein [Escherichia coli]EGO7536097.1 hypothetical protein [Escherichia coli]EGQ6879375.1 hypothetical protein [Escherichia coli]